MLLNHLLQVAFQGGVFIFQERSPAAGQTHVIGGPARQVQIQFLSAPADRLDVHPGDLRQQRVAAMADLHRFQRHVPSPLLLIQTTQQQVHLSMNRLVGMILRLLTDWTLTDVKRGSILHNDEGRSIDPATS
jgi:hypothetical protein